MHETNQTMSFTQQLLKVLSELDQTFLPDELAYLATTSKVEGPIRDRLAYRLHMELDPAQVFVHREWRDPKKNGWIDISVTDKKNYPLQLIELKAHSGPTFEGGFSKRVREDLEKLYKASEDATELYAIFLFNHLYHPSKIDSMFQHVVKYYDIQNFASRKHDFVQDVRDKTKENWEKHLQRIGIPLNKTHPGIYLKAGSFYMMPMEVHAYVLGPLNKAELAKVFD